MLNIKKRDGNIVPFNLNKIKVAIEKAFTAVGKNYNDDIIDMLALRVTATFNDKVKNDVVSVEDIQDSVEVVLILRLAGTADATSATAHDRRANHAFAALRHCRHRRHRGRETTRLDEVLTRHYFLFSLIPIK